MKFDPSQAATADEFISRLRRFAQTPWPRESIYRGQADADWKLVASAFRPGAEFWHGRQFRWHTIEEGDGQRLLNHATAELETLALFFDVADEEGLPLPEDSQRIRSRLREANRETLLRDWPSLDLRSILALAQHHGLPTRLLDWTWDWRVAAYFAARDTFRQREPAPKDLAVWTLSVAALQFDEASRASLSLSEMVADARSPRHPYRMHIVTAPAATNVNLRAQKGLFTLLEARLESADPATPIDELGEYDLADIDPLALRKLTLPVSEAGALLRQLAYEGLTAASVFPGLDGVVRSLRERALWRERWQP